MFELNIEKYKNITFVRHTKVDTFYCIANAVLDKVQTILDLGILLDHFRDNISMLVNKAYDTLGYFKGWSKEFSDS